MVMPLDNPTRGPEKIGYHQLFERLYPGCAAPQRNQEPDQACRNPAPIVEVENWSEHIIRSFTSPEGKRIDEVEEKIVLTRTVYRESPPEQAVIETEGTNATAETGDENTQDESDKEKEGDHQE